MQAFLQHIVNGGGRVEREYGLGRGCTDLLIVWNYPGSVQRAVIELKVLRKAPESTLAEGLAQTWEYRPGDSPADVPAAVWRRIWRDATF
jgi:hypothetical protein